MIWNNDVDGITLLYILDLVSSFASLIGSTLVCYFCTQRIKISNSVSLKFIRALSSADIVYSISNIMSSFETPIGEPNPTSGLNPDGMCYTEAVIRQMGFYLTLLFAACLSVCSYKSTTAPNFNQYLFFKVAILGSITVSAFFTTLPLFIPQIGYLKGPEYCWITYSDSVTTYPMKYFIRCIYEGFPVTGSFLVTLVAYTKVVIKIKQLPQTVIDTMNISENRLFWYPCVLLFGFFPGFIDNMIGIYISSRPLVIEALHLVLGHSIGFTNALVYWGQRRLYVEPTEPEPENSHELTRQPFSGFSGGRLTDRLSDQSLDSFDLMKQQSSGVMSLREASQI